MGTDALHPDPFANSNSGGDGSRKQPLPSSLVQVTTIGAYALITGVLLMGVSFLTNPVPDPSLPLATHPASLRVDYTQPRIEHWPVTYTIDLWLVVFTLPLVLLGAYQRYGPRLSFRPSTWLAGVSRDGDARVHHLLSLLLARAAAADVERSLVAPGCRGYCSTYDPLWNDLVYAVALFGVGATYRAYRDSAYAKHALATFGILAFPLGVPTRLDAYRRDRT